MSRPSRQRCQDAVHPRQQENRQGSREEQGTQRQVCVHLVQYVLGTNNTVLFCRTPSAVGGHPTETPSTPSTGVGKTPLRRAGRVPAVGDDPDSDGDDSSDFEGTTSPHPTNNNPTTTTTTITNNTRGSPSPSETPSPSRSPQRQTPAQPPPSDALETNDRMSKEKQKFFRLSAFNADKKREKRLLQPKNQQELDKTEQQPKKDAGSRLKENAKRPVQPVKKVQVCRQKNGVKKEISAPSPAKSCPKQFSNKIVPAPQHDKKVVGAKKKPENKIEEPKLSESSSECSSSSDDDDDSSDDSDSGSTSSSNSDSRMSIDKIPGNIFSSSNNKVETFGSISGITVDKDVPWGFAAAAAEAQKKDGLYAFGNTSRHDDNFDNSRLQADEKNGSKSLDKSQATRVGIGQLKSLFDGLSHLFAPPTSNRASRGSAPNYNPNRRKPKENEVQRKEPKIERLRDRDTLSKPKDVQKPKRREQELKSEPPAKVVKIEDEEKMDCSRPDPPVHTVLLPRSPLPSAPPSTVPSSSDCSSCVVSPSGMVKRAVNSKQLQPADSNSRKLAKGEALAAAAAAAPSRAADACDVKKRPPPTTATTVAAPFANSQTGKIGSPYHQVSLPQSPPQMSISLIIFNYIRYTFYFLSYQLFLIIVYYYYFWRRGGFGDWVRFDTRWRLVHGFVTSKYLSHNMNRSIRVRTGILSKNILTLH